MPPVLPLFSAVSHGVKLNSKRRSVLSENSLHVKNGPQSKRKADESPPKKQTTKRPALINVTNNEKPPRTQNTVKDDKVLLLPLKKDTIIVGRETRAKSKTRLSDTKSTNIKNFIDENKTNVAKQNVKKSVETSKRVDIMMPVLKNLTNSKTTKFGNIFIDGKKSICKENSSSASNTLISKPRTKSSLVTGVKLPASTKNKSQKSVPFTSLGAINESEASCSKLDPSIARRQTRLSASITATKKANVAVASEKQCSELDTSLTRMQTRLSTSIVPAETKAKLAAKSKKPCPKLDTSLTRVQTRSSTSIAASEHGTKVIAARKEPCRELDTSLTRMQTRLSTSIAASEHKSKATVAGKEPCRELDTSFTRMQTRLSTSLAAIENKAKLAKENIPSVNENRVMTRLSSRKSLTEKSLTNNSLYMSALEDPAEQSIKKEKKTAKEKLLDSLSEFDRELVDDPLQVSLYAMEIFEYLKSREIHFLITDYVNRQPDITKHMRAMLVDWMAEVQENFELNHETLYLAVKLVDLYLDKVRIDKSTLQLLGAAAIFLACKYDERLSPALDDFVYVSDGAYDSFGLLEMEQRILKIVNYELSVPISYSFLRRYARCARIQMPLLTLARFILEFALMSYETVSLSDSKQAAAALYLARKMNKLSGWSDSLVYYTGYELDDFKDIVILFNNILHEKSMEDLKSIRTKYSHKVFFRVAETPLLKNAELNLDS